MEANNNTYLVRSTLAVFIQNHEKQLFCFFLDDFCQYTFVLGNVKSILNITHYVIPLLSNQKQSFPLVLVTSQETKETR